MTAENSSPSGALEAGETIESAAWLGSSQFLRQFVAIGTTVVLTRFLSPTEYGIFAMTLFVSELALKRVRYGQALSMIRPELRKRIVDTGQWREHSKQELAVWTRGNEPSKVLAATPASSVAAEPPPLRQA